MELEFCLVKEIVLSDPKYKEHHFSTFIDTSM